MLGVRGRAIKVTDRYRRYLFVFDSSKDRDASYTAVHDKWNRALGECDLLSFVEVPIGRTIPIGMGALLEDEKEFHPSYREEQRELMVLWEEYLKKHGRKVGMVEDAVELHQMLQSGGIPDNLRPWAWTLFSGANYKSHCAPQLGLYHSLVRDTPDQDVMDEIHKDIHRSFPAHQFFQTVRASRGLFVVPSLIIHSLGVGRRYSFLGERAASLFYPQS